MKHYFGGYYLIRLKPINFGSEFGKSVYTCSGCINDNLTGIWAHSWTTGSNKAAEIAKDCFKLTDDSINSIRTWVDKKYKEKKVGWLNVFTEIESAFEYKNTFFSHLDNIKILALYFDENEAKDILEEFKPQSKKDGEIGLRLALLKQREEIENDDELFLGYDFIGIEYGFGNFHTFHCHDIGTELSDKFKLKMNKYGLFDKAKEWKPVIDYLNDEKSPVEPLPWFVTTTKLITK